MLETSRFLRPVAVVAAAAAFGAGSSVALSACGEDREGDVEIEGGTTGGGTTGGATTGGAGTGSETGTTGAETGTSETGTEPETETESETGTTE